VDLKRIIASIELLAGKAELAVRALRGSVGEFSDLSGALDVHSALPIFNYNKLTQCS